MTVINNHTCPTCKNTRVSKDEKTCWKCGSPLHTCSDILRDKINESHALRLQKYKSLTIKELSRLNDSSGTLSDEYLKIFFENIKEIKCLSL